MPSQRYHPGLVVEHLGFVTLIYWRGLRRKFVVPWRRVCIWIRIERRFGKFLGALALLSRSRILRPPTADEHHSPQNPGKQALGRSRGETRKSRIGLQEEEGRYLDVDFAGLFNGFLFYEGDHALQLLGDLFIA